MPEYVWVYDNRQGTEYVSNNTKREVTLQVNEYFLRDRPIQNLVKDLRWGLSDCNGTRTHNLVVRKLAHSHLSKLARWLSCVVSTYLYRTFDCMFLSRHVCVSEWIHSLELPDCNAYVTWYEHTVKMECFGKIIIVCKYFCKKLNLKSLRGF